MRIKTNQFLALTLAVVLLVSTLPGCSSTLTESQPEPESFKVSMDVNPSIEFTITDELVSSVDAFNDDGTAIIMATNVLGMTATDAVTSIVKEMVAAGYIAKSEIKPYLLITVSEDETRDSEVSEALTESLETAAVAALDENELGCKVKSTLVSGEVEAASDALGLSIGRYLLFKYIAEEEEVTIEAALETYGHMTIGELMDMFEDAKFAYKYKEIKEEDKEESDESSSDLLTPEQQLAMKAAFAALKLDREAARVVFHETYKSIKETYKTGLEALRVKGKKTVESDVQSQRALLRETMLADRRAALVTRTDAVAAAKARFLLAVSGLGISDEILDDILDDVDEEEEDADEDIDEDTDESENSSSEASSIENSSSEESSSEVSSEDESSVESEESEDESDDESEESEDDSDDESEEESSTISTENLSIHGKK
ncbi:MAG: anti-sigma-I factor RsgI family protein [Saccharofermentanales bacterium]